VRAESQLRLVIVAASLGLASGARAQVLQPEVRVDALGPTPFTIEPGVGANVFLGNYVRVGAIAGFNVRRHPAFTGNSWRGEVIARVTLDPFRQQRLGLSIGGGVSFRPIGARLAALVEMEGPELRGVLPALQFGVSGGVRAGLVVRRAVPRRR
jgi:hypothetical protein